MGGGSPHNKTKMEPKNPRISKAATDLWMQSSLSVLKFGEVMTTTKPTIQTNSLWQIVAIAEQ